MNLIISLLLLYLLVTIICKFIPFAQKRIDVHLFLSFILLFTFHAFKDWNFLPDLGAYAMHFYDSEIYEFKEHLLYSRMEPGWLLMNHFLFFILPDHIILSVFTSFVIIGSYFFAIKRYSVNYAFSILLFLLITYTQSLFVLRQHMAVAVLFFSIKYIVNRDLKRFLLILLLACSIHMTAIVFLPAYFVYKLKIDKKFFLIVLLGCLFMFFFFQSVVSYFTSGTYIGGYLEKETHGTWTGTGIMCCVLALSMILLDLKHLDNAHKLFFQLLCVGLCFEIGGAVSNSDMMGRLNWYYTVYVIFMIPKAVEKQQLFKKILIISCVLLGYGIIWYNTVCSESLESIRLIF